MAVWTSPSGKTLVDFGQNLVGWLKITTTGEAGSTITVRHAEVIEHAELGTRPLRSARATDTFIRSGGLDVFEPTLTFHGFRYAEVTGLDEPISADNVVAVVVHSDLPRIGTFACSDELVNQLHRNVVWSQRGNFLDLPTDCPQRDERQGWTGDIAVFAPTAAYLFDVSGFLRDWLLDLAAEQRAANDIVPLVVPDVLKLLDNATGWPSDTPTAIWSDAGVWVPWALWEAYGDREVLEQCHPSMAAHVRACARLVSAERSVGHGLPARRLARPDRTAGEPVPGQGRQVRDRDGLPLSQRGADRPERRRARAGPTTRPSSSALAERTRAAFSEHYVECRRHHRRATARPCTPWRSRSTCWIPRPSVLAGRRLADAGGRGRVPDRHRLRRHPVRDRGAQPHRPRRARRTGCCCRPRTRPGSTRSPWAPPPSGSAGTRCCPTAPSTRAR